MSSYSRKRPMAGGSSRANIAAAIGARAAAKYPYSSFGRMNVKRGSMYSTRMFGPSFKGATYTQQSARKLYGFVGRGAYFGRKFGAAAGMALGTAAAPYLGPTGVAAPLVGRDVGGYLGNMAENAAIRYSTKTLNNYMTGSGAYKMQGVNHATNALIKSKNPVSMTVGSDTGAIFVTRSEYIKDITPTASGFQTQFSASLNPGIADSFEWISQIAQFYEQYEFVQLFYEFKSTVTPGNSTAMGTVSITPLQTESPLYVDKNSMSFAQGFVNASVSKHLLAGVECHPSKIYGGSVKRVRTGPISDPSLINYDYGTIQVACSDCTANQTVGELWCHFTVKLSQPRLGSVSNGDTSNDLNFAEVYNANVNLDIVPAAVASQTSTNLFGFTNYLPTVDSSGIVTGDGRFQCGLLSNSADYRYAASGTPSTVFSANVNCFKCQPVMSGLVVYCSFTYPLTSDSGTLASGVAWHVAPAIAVATFGNATLGTFQGGVYVKSKDAMNQISIATTGAVSWTGTLTAGGELVYDFYISFGDCSSLSSGFLLQGPIATAGFSNPISTSVATSMVMITMPSGTDLSLAR